MRATTHLKTPAQYLASLPAERQAALTKLHRAIRQATPSLKPGIACGMIGYGTGRAGESPMVALASQKQYISLYICAGAGMGMDKRRLGNVSVGRSCIRFTRLADLNFEAAMELVRRAAG